MKKYYLEDKIIRHLNKSSIVVIRHKNGKLTMSKPCKNCISFMKTLGIKKIYYSNENGNIIVENIKKIKTTHISCTNRYYL